MYSKTRKALRKYLYEEHTFERDIWQRRPWTMVEVRILFDGAWYSALGFSKVNWPDSWDPSYGVDMATRKAIADIAKAIMLSLPQHYSDTPKWYRDCMETGNPEHVLANLCA